MFDLTNGRGRDSDVQPPRLFAPTPAPTPEILVTNAQTKRASLENLTPGGIASGEKGKGSTMRSQRIRLEPVRMPIPRLHSATSTSSLPSCEDTATTVDQPLGRKPSALTLKKASSNIDVTPNNSSQGKVLASRQKSQSTFRPPLKTSALQKNIPPLVSSPIRRTASSNSVKNSSPSPSNSPRRGSEQLRLSSPDRKVSGDSHNSPASPSDGSEGGSDRDVRSPTLSSSSEGEVS